MVGDYCHRQSGAGIRAWCDVRIVEWTDGDGPHKVTLPDDCEDKNLGIPYGYPWEVIKLPEITGAVVARALRERGIWTTQDLRTNVKTARAAVQDVANRILTALLESVREV